MEIQTIELKKLTASTGYILTNGEVYGAEVYLGCNDTPDNWREIAEEEYEEILKAQEERYAIIDELIKNEANEVDDIQ